MQSSLEVSDRAQFIGKNPNSPKKVSAFYHFWPKKLYLEIFLKLYVMLGQYILTKKKVVEKVPVDPPKCDFLTLNCAQELVHLFF